MSTGNRNPDEVGAARADALAADPCSRDYDALTVLHSAHRPRKLMAKRHVWSPGKQGATAALKTIDYPGGAYLFTVESKALSGFDDLAAALSKIARDPYRIVIRGALIAGRDPSQPMRRLSQRNRNRKTGEITPASFEPCPRRWIALDVDKLPNPEGHNPADDPDAALEYVLEHIPLEFRNASCWTQWTASQNLDVLDGGSRAPGALNCRLWFWLSRPVSDTEAKAWLCSEHDDGSSEWPSIDSSLYGGVHQHYTAAPIWDGRPDPLPRRFMVREGETNTVDVPHIEIRSPADRRRPDESEAAPLDIMEDGETLTAKNKAALISALVDAWPGIGGRHEFSLAVADGILRQGVSVRETREIVCQAACGAGDEQADDRVANVESTADNLASGNVGVTGWTRAIEIAGDREALERARKACTTKRTIRPPLPNTPPTWPADGLVSLDEGERQTAEAIDTWWREMAAWNAWTLGQAPPTGPAPVHAVPVTMGGGKTHIAIERARDLPAGETLYFGMPDHALGRELEQRFRDRGIPARTVRGLGQTTDDGRPMCRHWDNIMRPWIAAGLPATKLCERCPDRATCPTEEQRQRKNEPGVVIGPHQYSTMTADQRPFQDPACAIFDENPLAALTHGTDAPIAIEIADLASPPLDFGEGIRPKKGLGLETARNSRTNDVGVTMTRVAKAIHAGDFTPGGLRKHGLDADRCREAETAWYGRKRTIDAEALSEFEADTINAAIEAASGDTRARLMARFFRLLAFYLADSYPADGAMNAFERVSLTDKETRIEADCIRMIWSDAPKLSCPILLLDGTLNEGVARQLFPDLSRVTSVRIDAPHTRVVQVVEGGVSMRRLGATDVVSDSDAKGALNRRRRIMELAETAAAQSLPDAHGTRAVVFTFKRTRADIERELANRIESEGSDQGRRQWTRLPGGIDLAHGGHIRGVDRWKSTGASVVACRPLPRVADLERAAWAIYWRDPEPIQTLPPGDQLPRKMQSIRLRNGEGRGVYVPTHPDPRCAAVLDQICRAEVEQIVHRLRLVRRTAENPATVYLLTETPIDLAVDDYRTFDGVVPDPLELLLARGVLPEGWRLTQAILADRFVSPNAARQWFADNPEIGSRRAEVLANLKCAEIPLITYKGNFCAFCRYRVKFSKGNAQWAWLDVSRHPDPLAAFQCWLGPEAVVSVEAAPLAMAGARTDHNDYDNVKNKGSILPEGVLAALPEQYARTGEIDAAGAFLEAPMRTPPPADDFEAEALDAFGGDNVLQIVGRRPANDPTGEPLP